MTSSAILVFEHPLTLSEAKEYFKKFGKESFNQHSYDFFPELDLVLQNFKIIKVAPAARAPRRALTAPSGAPGAPAARAPRAPRRRAPAAVAVAPGVCEEQVGGRYASNTRRGPPYPANELGCHGLFKRGKDGVCYQSVPDRNNRFAWKKTTEPGC